MYKNIVIAILVIIVFLFIKDKSEYIGNPSVIIDTDTVYQQKTFVKYKKGESIPFVVLDTTYLIDEVHDTITIVKDYNQAKVYSDTIRIDSLGYASTSLSLGAISIWLNELANKVIHKNNALSKAITLLVLIEPLSSDNKFAIHFILLSFYKC